MYNQQAYDKFVNEAKEVKEGIRGWVSITQASKESGVSKEQLIVVCKALGLQIDQKHGRHGTTASK